MSRSSVTDYPVARTTDPLESYLAGESQSAREASELAVLEILRGAAHHNVAFSAHEVESTASESGDPWTPQRLRTAIAQLRRKGLVVEAGRREGASPTGRAAMTYTLAEAVAK
jgi:hypothetical protein